MCCKVLKRAKRYKNTQDEIDKQYVEMLEPTLTSTSKVQAAKHLGRAELDLTMERKGKFNERFVHEGTNIIKGYNNQCVITTWDHNVETMGINRTESSPVGTHL